MVSIVHEALLLRWDTLKSAIAKEYPSLRERARFEESFRRWTDNERRKGLLEGESLSEAITLQERNDIALRDPDARAFLRASREHRDTELATRNLRLRRRSYLAAFAAIVAVILAVAAGFFGISAQKSANMASGEAANARTTEANAASEASVARSAETNAQAQAATAVAAQAQAQREAAVSDSQRLSVLAQAALQAGNLNSALLLAASAAQRNDDNELANTTLHDILGRIAKLERTLEGHTDAITTALFGPNGMRILTASDDGTAKVSDAASGQLLVILQDGFDVTRAAFSHDGTRILTASGGGTVKVWDAASGQLLVILPGHGFNVTSAAFSSDGTRVVAASRDGDGVCCPHTRSARLGTL